MSEDQTKKPNEAEALEARKAKARLFVESFEGGVKPHTRRLELHGKDPECDYRLVKNTPEHLDYRKQMGYEPCTENDIKSTSMKQADGRLIIAGAYVVMKRDRLIGDAHRKYLAEKAEKMSKGPRESFRTKARKLGVETEDKSRSRIAPLSTIADSSDSDPNFRE